MSHLFPENKAPTVVKRREIANKKGQQGAVIAEFVVIVGFVLVPLIIGLMFIGKYIDTAQKMEVAARYSIWERTVWFQEVPETLEDMGIDTEKSPLQITNELENRVFSDKNTAIYFAQNTNEVNETEEVMSQSYWVDNSGNRISLYTHEDNNFITVGDGKEDEMYGYTSGLLDILFSVFGAIGSFDIDLKGAMSSTVSLTLIKPQFLDDIWADDITVSRSQTILADGWNAAGPTQAKSRVEGLTITKLLDWGVFNDFRDIISLLPMANELSSSSLIFGHVDPDVVPDSRLKIYTTNN